MKVTPKFLGLMGGGVAGVSALCVGAYLLTREDKKDIVATSQIQKQEKDISQWLIANGREMLLESDEWTNNWANFKKDFPKTNPPTEKWNIANWETAFESSGLTELKRKCSVNATEKITSASGTLYDQVKKYCTKEKKPSPTP